MEELIERLSRVIKEFEEVTTSHKSFQNRLKKLEYDSEMLAAQNQTILKQQGAVRIAIKNIKDTLIATITGFKGSIETLSRGFSVVEDDLLCTLGYTKEEIERMSAQDYRVKILKPLGMDRAWQK